MNNPSPNTERRLAVLIDGDNISYKHIEVMLQEISSYGRITIKRNYGDWTKPNLVNWQEPMLIHAIQPIQQFRHTIGKNVSDSALIIDAMDILYSGNVEGFCIISSDSDFTRLATRLREPGLFVIGMGRKGTPASLVKACDRFIYIENLLNAQETEQLQIIETMKKVPVKPETVKQQLVKEGQPEPLKDENHLFTLLQAAFNNSVQDDGWAFLGMLGNAIYRIEPDFDPRTYGHKSLLKLIEAHPVYFSIKGKEKDGPSVIYVKMKPI